MRKSTRRTAHYTIIIIVVDSILGDSHNIYILNKMFNNIHTGGIS